MILFDIVIAILLLTALYAGWSKGFFVQLAGLAGLVIGVWFAIRSGRTLGLWLGVNEKYAALVGFMIILVVVIFAVSLVGRLFKGIFGFAGLGLIDKLAGVVLSLGKTWLIAGLLVWGFDSLDRAYGWTKGEKAGRSVFYAPLVQVTTLVFPYIESLKDTFSPLWDDGDDSPGERNRIQNG